MAHCRLNKTTALKCIELAKFCFNSYWLVKLNILNDVHQSAIRIFLYTTALCHCGDEVTVDDLRS